MKNKIFIYILIPALTLMTSLVVVYTVFAKTVPDNLDFKGYMEREYDVNCLDQECHSFEVEVPSDKHGETINFLRHSGKLDKTSTSLIIDNYYFSEPSSMYYLHINVEGKLGKFNVIEEEDNLEEIGF